MSPAELLRWLRERVIADNGRPIPDNHEDLLFAMGYVLRVLEEMTVAPAPVADAKGKPVFVAVDESQDIGCNLKVEFVAPRHFYLSAVKATAPNDSGVTSVGSVYLSREAIAKLARFAGVLP